MRLPLIKPADLTPEQKPLYQDMKTGIESSIKGFQAMHDDGTLIGTWNPWLHFPKIGGPYSNLVKALYAAPILPKKAREVAVLATGAHFHSGYELYSHMLMAEQRGLDDNAIATIVAGQRPQTLKEDEGVAYDVASAALRGGVMPEPVYKRAVEQFGPIGAAKLLYFIGLYCMISITLNGFDVPVPETGD